MRNDALTKLEEFFSQFKLLHYKKREIILRADETPSGIFYLQKGFVRSYLITMEGQEFTTLIYKEKDLFPVRWAITGDRNARFFEAMTTVEVWRAPREKFLNFIKTEPSVFFHMTKRILNRLEAVLERMEYLAFGNAYKKVASMILFLSERFGKKLGKDIVIQIPFTHRDVAALIGITRETTTIEMLRLKKSGIVRRYRNFIAIRNIKQLKRESLLQE